MLYELPHRYVVGLTTLRLQCLPNGMDALPKHEMENLFSVLEVNLRCMQSIATLQNLKNITDTLCLIAARSALNCLLESRATEVLDNMYRSTMPKVSFLDYFWSWRGLFGGLFSVLLADLPPAKTYHALCTGYAGLLLARAHRRDWPRMRRD